jgi:16S rRNA (guanine(966)-N(2))-methyltransferase RsmD
MRVIGGEFRSRKIKSLPGTEMRPTPDKLRETLFDILSAQVSGSTFLDAYAGTGAVGIEALSRGATRAVFIEKSRSAVALIRENLESLGVTPRTLVITGPSLRELGKNRADIVFLDPPYPLEKEYAPALELSLRAAPRLVIAQHSVRFDPGDHHGPLVRYRIVRQGDNALSLYSTP